MLDPQQSSALAIMQSGANVFLSGMAGTGKSYLIQQYIGQTCSDQVNMCATTGIAALNLQNSILEATGKHIPANTIYRWAGISIGPRNGQTNDAFYQELETSRLPSYLAARARIKKAQTLIIDEISMLPGKILSYLDFHFRAIRASKKPFGGIQLILVGDFLQLPPVSKTQSYDWAFSSPSWDSAGFHNCFLSIIHRQSDKVFIEILNDFRVGNIRNETARILQNRIAKFPKNDIVRLFTHNVQVDKWNNLKLENIDQKEHAFTAKTAGYPAEVAFLLKNMTTPEVLRIKIFARVMITTNLSSAGQLYAANGETGTVTDISPDSITVRKDNGETIYVSKFTFAYDRNKENSGTVVQFPLRLAYAMTIHKSQGLTLNKAIVDIRAARDPGQAYVAVSRVRSLDGLWLKDSISGVFVSPSAIAFYRNLSNIS